MTTLQPITLRTWSQQLVRFLRVLGYGAVCLAFVLELFLLFIMTFSWCFWPDSRVDRAWLDIRNIGNALKLYSAKTGRYPTTEEGLRAMVERGILEQDPRDPWNNEYRYLLWMGCPVVWSYGRDEVPGGGGQDADLSSMGSSPPPWVLQRASQPTLSPFPRYCPWISERGS